MKLVLAAVALVVAVAFFTVQRADTQERPTRLEVWDLELGTHAADLPSREFLDISCGTNGGPPSRPLGTFANFGKCKPDENGLYEVYFRYDDQLEYWARANRAKTMILLFSGTTAYSHPVIVSLLFNEAGIASGLRLVTDPASDRRSEAFQLRNFLRARFLGPDGWNCVDTPPAEGETPVGEMFVKERCEKNVDGNQRVILATNFFRKPGQAFIDRHTGRRTEGQFESSTRLEVYLLAALPAAN